MATGVLPVFVGRATRAVEFASESEKEYIAGLKLGVVTNTQDTTGQVVEERPVEADRAALEGALAAFRGEITQIPPMYSALKRDGKKLYELARAGKEVERAPRPVTIHALEVPGPDRGRTATPCGCAAPRGPMCVPSATTSGPPWAAAGACPPCAAPRPPGFPWRKRCRWRRCWTHLTRRPAPAGGRLFLPLSGGDGGRDGPAQGEERQPVSLLRGRRRLAGVRPRRGIPAAGRCAGG